MSRKKFWLSHIHISQLLRWKFVFYLGYVLAPGVDLAINQESFRREAWGVVGPSRGHIFLVGWVSSFPTTIFSTPLFHEFCNGLVFFAKGFFPSLIAIFITKVITKCIVINVRIDSDAKKYNFYKLADLSFSL